MSEAPAGYLAELERGFGLTLAAGQKRQMRVYLAMLARWNQQINLTAIERVDEQLRLNFFESFWAAREFLPAACRLADVGSGAGIPGLALKLYRPGIELVLIEPNYKKAVFLKEACRELGLAAEVFTGKGEDYPDWDRVEWASFRALKPSTLLLGQLAKAGVALLLFEGREELPVPGYRRRRKAAVPGSANRFVSLAAPEEPG
jgi:16S rRNA (guanine(527)-N(7))-methyltransferase RsmG